MKNKRNVIVGLCASLLFLSSALIAKERNSNQRHLGKVAEGANSSPAISVLNITIILDLRDHLKH